MRVTANVAHADSADMRTGCGCVCPSPGRPHLTAHAADIVPVAARTVSPTTVGDAPGRGMRRSHSTCVRITTHPAWPDGYKQSGSVPWAVSASLRHPGVPVGEHVLDAGLGLRVSRDYPSGRFRYPEVHDVVAKGLDGLILE